MQTKLMAIINLTPDSFSDGGAISDVASAIEAARLFISQGADVIDIGAESTRPGATPLDAMQEWERLSPVLSGVMSLAHESRIDVSVDTRHWQTAKKALLLGADWINDVSGLADTSMREVLRDHPCRIVLMHQLGIPADPELVLDCAADEVVDYLLTQARISMEFCEAEGLSRERLIYDPGIGFGKNLRQNLAILSSASSFKELSIPLLFGYSRKRFMQCITDQPAPQRDDVTAAYSSLLMMQGIDYLRVHALGKHATLRRALSGKL
ncbi:MAG: dihydropteroate synthase [Rickettsiales bacterium]|nr:dihydropteroate synthase [Rickettsiales bacterium]